MGKRGGSERPIHLREGLLNVQQRQQTLSRNATHDPASVWRVPSLRHRGLQETRTPVRGSRRADRRRGFRFADRVAGMITLLEKTYDGESMIDVSRDVREAFMADFTPEAGSIPSDT